MKWSTQKIVFVSLAGLAVATGITYLVITIKPKKKK